MTAVLLFFVGLGGVLAIGTPIVGLLPSSGTLRGWFRRAQATPPPDRPALPVRPFTPLDLGPDPMHWPSEQPWPESRVPMPDWPSKSWNDEHFGAYWRAPHGARSTRPAPTPAAPSRAPRRSPAEARAEASEEAFFGTPSADATLSTQATPPRPPPRGARSADGRAADPARTVDPAAPKIPRPPQPGGALGGTRERPANPARKPAAPTQKAAAPNPKATPPAPKAAPRPATPKPSPQSAPPPQKPPPNGAAGAPTREELESLVATAGLAGAVKIIMDRTGWDFRTAAQYLSRNR